MRVVELCAGSAALSRHLLGVGRLLPYMGGKDRYAPAIARECGVLPGDVTEAILVDPGPLPEAVALVAAGGEPRARVLARLREWATVPKEARRDLWERIRSEPVPEERVERVARLLLLQRWGFRSRPVTDEGGQWQTHGFGVTDAEGLFWEGVTQHGVHESRHNKPKLPHLIARIEAMPIAHVTALGQSATPELVDRYAGPDTLVYIDPPYQGTSGYAHDLPRDAVLDLAQRAHDLGARVAVSEAEPVRDDWRAVDLASVAHRRRGPNSWQTSEWLTCSPLAVPRQAGLFGSPLPPLNDEAPASLD